MTEKALQQAVRWLFQNHDYILVNSYVFDWESDFFSITKTGTVYEVEMKISRSDFRKDFEKPKHDLFQSNAAGKTHHIIRNTGINRWDRSRLLGEYIDPGIHWQHPKGYYWDWKKGVHVSGYGAALFNPRKVEVFAPCTSIKITPLESILCPNRFYYACPPGIIPKAEVPSYAGLLHVTGQTAEIVKQAPFLHKRKIQGERLYKILLDKFYFLSRSMRFELIRNNIEFKDCPEPGAQTITE